MKVMLDGNVMHKIFISKCPSATNLRSTTKPPSFPPKACGNDRAAIRDVSAYFFKIDYVGTLNDWHGCLP